MPTLDSPRLCRGVGRRAWTRRLSGEGGRRGQPPLSPPRWVVRCPDSQPPATAVSQSQLPRAGYWLGLPLFPRSRRAIVAHARTRQAASSQQPPSLHLAGSRRLSTAPQWKDYLLVLTRFPGRRFILARGLLHDCDLPGFHPPGWHLLLRLEASEAAHLLPTDDADDVLDGSATNTHMDATGKRPRASPSKKTVKKIFRDDAAECHNGDGCTDPGAKPW